MKTATIFLLTVMSFWVSSSCLATDQKLDQAVARVKESVHAFETAKHRYPQTLTDLQAFVAATHPIDLTPFAKVDFQFHNDHSLTILLHTNPPDNNLVMLGFDQASYH